MVSLTALSGEHMESLDTKGRGSGRKPLLPYADALTLLESRCKSFIPGISAVELPHAVDRVLAATVALDRDEPPVRRSAMDGFAVIAADGVNPRAIVGVLYAGTSGLPTIESGQAMAVMTGGTVPNGADTVVPVENTNREGDTLLLAEAPESGRHVRQDGEMGKAGRVILEVGRRLTAGDLAAAASCGVGSVQVYDIPRAAVLATGDEVVHYTEIPGPHQVRDSNRLASQLQLQGFGAKVVMEQHVPDKEQELIRAVNAALDQSDLVVTIGGVSMGDKDFMPRVFAACGVEFLFHKVALQPGKPVWAGKRGNTFVLGLPGNPISSFTVLELFGRLLVDRLGGATTEYPRPLRYGTATTTLRSRKRPRWLPCKLSGNQTGTDLQVTPCQESGSGDWTSLATADALLHLPPDSQLQAGDRVAYLPLANP
jgi:molybdopterin molybdotransferase